MIKSSRQSSFTIPTVIDVEASGFGSCSYPIEVGVIDASGNRFCRLIKPHSDWVHWDENAQALHGISQKLLQEKGEPITTVCHQLNTFLEGQVVYSDGWVVDDSWLIKLYSTARINMLFHLSSLEMILNEQQMALWHTTKDKLFGEMQEQRHRASTDAALIQNTFITTQQMCFNTQSALKVC